MVNFPSTLPPVRAQGYGVDPVEQTLRTQMEAGAARVRRISRAELDTVPVTWVFTDGQMQIFRAWFRDAAAGADGGAAWFGGLALPLGNGGYTTGQCRFTGSPPWKAARIAGRIWRVTATVEVRYA